MKGWNGDVHVSYTQLFGAAHDMDIICIDFYVQDIHGLILKVDILLIPHWHPHKPKQWYTDIF